MEETGATNPTTSFRLLYRCTIFFSEIMKYEEGTTVVISGN
jgi:hypothetical protein